MESNSFLNISNILPPKIDTSTPKELIPKEIPFYLNFSEEHDSGYFSNATVPHFKNMGYSTAAVTSGSFSAFKDLVISPRPPPLDGKSQVDFIYQLSSRQNLPTITAIIMSHLSSKDLYNMTKVSKSWRNAVYNEYASNKRLNEFLNCIELSKENENEQVSMEEESDTQSKKSSAPSTGPRIRFSEIQNIHCNSGSSGGSSLASSNISTPISPSKFKFHMYQKEGQKLQRGERLFSCAQCSFPSQKDCQTPLIAQCTNSHCKYRFCILCHCQEHPNRMCNLMSTPSIRSRNRSGAIGSLKSKKNLKRLLM